MSETDRDEAVRLRAYLLWERAGRPAGREHEFWAEASAEIEGDPREKHEPRHVAR